MRFHHRSVAYALLRIAVGFVFLFYGIEKLRSGILPFAQGLEKDFSKTWLPSPTVFLFGLVLPFLEVIIGSLLILGLFTLLAATFGTLLLTVLTTGLIISGNSAGVAHNLIYSIIFFLLLYYADDNGFCLDRKFGNSDSKIYKAR